MHSHGIRPENPFSTRHTRPGALPFLVDSDGAPVDAARLARRVISRHRSSIVGPHGTGKTTLLAHMRPHLEQENRDCCRWATLCNGEPSTELWNILSAVPTTGIMIVDGYEQLVVAERLRLIGIAWRRRIRLLVTAHHPPRLFDVISHTGTSRQTARLLAAALLDDFPAHREIMMRAFDEHWDGADGNIRQLWATLYERFENQLETAGK